MLFTGIYELHGKMQSLNSVLAFEKNCVTRAKYFNLLLVQLPRKIKTYSFMPTVFKIANNLSVLRG